MKRKSAFTFVELLIALTLFMVGMLSVLQIFPANRALLEQNSLTAQAVFLAQKEMETLRTVPYDSLTVGNYTERQAMSGTPTDIAYPFEKQIVVKYLDTNRQESANDVGIKQVDLTLFWKQKAIDRQYSLSTYVIK